jgi:hypothetical protein
MLRVVVAALLVAGAVFASVAAAAAPPRPGRVFFLRGEQLAQVPRAGTSPAVALRHLIAGPTRGERALGFRSYVPPKTKLLGVRVVNGVATVDFDSRFVWGNNPASLLARLSEVVRTLTGLQGTKAAQLLINGKVTAGVFPAFRRRARSPSRTSRPRTKARRSRPSVSAGASIHTSRRCSYAWSSWATWLRAM